MDGAGECQHVYMGCAMFEQQPRDFVEGRAGVEQVVYEQDAPAFDLGVFHLS
jgi:hypothetical protein